MHQKDNPTIANSGRFTTQGRLIEPTIPQQQTPAHAGKVTTIRGTTANGGTILGVLDTARFVEGKIVVKGWACDVGFLQSIAVHVCNKPNCNPAEALEVGLAAKPSEGAINTLCNTAGINHRFQVELPGATLAGPLFVYGINANFKKLLAGSGRVGIPSSLKDLLVSQGASPTIALGNSVTIGGAAGGGRIEAGTITVQGMFLCDPEGPGFHLVLDNLIIQGAGASFECLVSSAAKGKEFKIELRRGGSIQAVNEGTLRLAGDPAKANREAMPRLGSSANPGDTQIQLRAAERGWEVGDEIVVATTRYHRQSPFLGGFAETFAQLDQKYGQYQEQNERRVITSVSADGGSFGIEKPLSTFHFGERPQLYDGGKFVLDEAAYVVNLNRNLKIFCTQGSNDGIGGHVFVAANGRAFIDAVELFGMGQMGEMGKYPFHWHRNNDVSGQFIQRSSIYDSWQRCLSVHGSDNARVILNTCFNVFSHGFFLEDGSEVGNVFEHNIAILIKKPPVQSRLLHSDVYDVDVDRFPAPAAYWVSHPSNHFTNNVAVASEGTGFWMAFVLCVCCDTNRVCTAKCDCPAPSRLTEPIKSAQGPFDHNVAASCVVGMNWDGAPAGELQNNPRNPSDRAIVPIHWRPPNKPTFTGLVMYKNSRRSLYVRRKCSSFSNIYVGGPFKTLMELMGSPPFAAPPPLPRRR